MMFCKEFGLLEDDLDRVSEQFWQRWLAFTNTDNDLKNRAAKRRPLNKAKPPIGK